MRRNGKTFRVYSEKILRCDELLSRIQWVCGQYVKHSETRRNTMSAVPAAVLDRKKLMIIIV